MAVQVSMHSKVNCPFCDQARDFLAANGIPYTEIKHDDAEEDRKILYDQLGLKGRSRTVPQTFRTKKGADTVSAELRNLRCLASNLCSARSPAARLQRQRLDGVRQTSAGGWLSWRKVTLAASSVADPAESIRTRN